MTTTNSRIEAKGTDNADAKADACDQELPDDYRQLARITAAAQAKMEELQSTRATTLRDKWVSEADALGMTVEQVFYGVAKKRRGRKPKHHE